MVEMDFRARLKRVAAYSAAVHLRFKQRIVGVTAKAVLVPEPQIPLVFRILGCAHLVVGPVARLALRGDAAALLRVLLVCRQRLDLQALRTAATGGRVGSNVEQRTRVAHLTALHGCCTQDATAVTLPCSNPC